jgi:hypothetical protein
MPFDFSMPLSETPNAGGRAADGSADADSATAATSACTKHGSPTMVQRGAWLNEPSPPACGVRSHAAAQPGSTSRMPQTAATAVDTTSDFDMGLEQQAQTSDQTRRQQHGPQQDLQELGTASW